MSIKHNKPSIPQGVSIDDMKDGQLAEVINSINTDVIGEVVQRYGSNVLIVIGKDSGKGYTSIFRCGSGMRVRILDINEKITITSN